MSSGIHLPLEVRKISAEVGFGVTCAVTIEPGEHIGDYIGEVHLNEHLNARPNADVDDDYIYALDHFALRHTVRVWLTMSWFSDTHMYAVNGFDFPRPFFFLAHHCVHKH